MPHATHRLSFYVRHNVHHRDVGIEPGGDPLDFGSLCIFSRIRKRYYLIRLSCHRAKHGVEPSGTAMSIANYMDTDGHLMPAPLTPAKEEPTLSNK